MQNMQSSSWKKSPQTSLGLMNSINKTQPANQNQNLDRSFTHGHNGQMTLKDIMLQKGSKCKCTVRNEHDDIFTKNENQQFDEISMGSS